MALRIEGDKYIIQNPDQYKSEATLRSGQLFKHGGGSEVGYIKDGTLYTGSASKFGVDTSQLQDFQDIFAFTREGLLKRADITDASQLQGLTGGNIGASVTPGTGFGQPVNTLTPEQLAPFERQAGMTTTQQSVQEKLAQAPTFQAASWQDPATGQTTPPGIGVPPQSPNTPPAGATYISSPQELKGLNESDIWRDPSSNRIYKLQKATLTSPTGEKKVVSVGSSEASSLLSSGWILGDRIDTTSITSPLLTQENDINLAKTVGNGSYKADTTYAGAKSDATAAEKEIQRLQELITPPETTTSQEYDALLKELGTLGESLTGRGATQLSEEEKRGLEDKRQALADKTSELNKKLAEIDALTASYNLENQREEGRPQTLSRLRGAQAQNYKMYLAQKNLLTSEAGFLQSEVLGLQGKVAEAQNAADRAVDLLYQDRQDAYNTKLAQLNVLLPQLNKEEASYGSAVKMYLENQAQATAEAKQAQKDALAPILNLMSKYPDAGITMNDTLDTAQSKLPNSRIYKQQTRLASSGGGGTTVVTGFDTKAAVPEMRSALSSVSGGDGYVSPDDYQILRKQWIDAGGDPAYFDKEFAGFQNPNNPYYINKKQSSSTQPEKTTSINNYNPLIEAFLNS